MNEESEIETEKVLLARPVLTCIPLMPWQLSRPQLTDRGGNHSRNVAPTP